MVVGGGLTGATAACVFASSGLRVGLVERARPPVAAENPDNPDNPDNPRVSALGLASSYLLESLGVWQRIPPAQCYPYQAMRVWDANSSADIGFSGLDLGEAQLGYIANNAAVVAAAMDALGEYAEAQVLRGSLREVQPEAERVRMTLQSADGVAQTVATQLLVGADGARSKVRELCGITLQSEYFRQHAIATTLRSQKSHQSTAWQCFLAEGPVAVLPLADDRCALVWSCERARAEQLLELGDAEFCAELQPIFARHLGAITHAEPRLSFPLSQPRAQTYLGERVALIGDAAHHLLPLAGLGANLGLRDAAALGEVVADAHARGRNIASRAVLRRYERWRRGDNAAALAAMQGFNDIFATQNAAARVVRSFGLNFAQRMPPLKNLFAKYATGLVGDLPKSCRRNEFHP